MKKSNLNSRRSFIKKSALVGVGISSPINTFAIGKILKENSGIVGHADFKYKVDKKWGIQIINYYQFMS